MGRKRNLEKVSSTLHGTTWITRYVLLCYVCFFTALSEILYIDSKPKAGMLVQVFTYHLAHRDLSHLVKNTVILAVLGAKLEKVIERERLFELCFVSLVVGGIVGTLAEAVVQGTSGLVLAFIGLHFFHYSKKIDIGVDRPVIGFFMIMFFFSLSFEYPYTTKINKREPTELGSEFGHLTTALFGSLIYPMINDPFRKDNSSTKLSYILTKLGYQPKPKEPEQKKPLMKRLRGFFANEDSGTDDSNSSEGSGTTRKKKKGGRFNNNNPELYENIPRNKLKPSQRFQRDRKRSEGSYR